MLAVLEGCGFVAVPLFSKIAINRLCHLSGRVRPLGPEIAAPAVRLYRPLDYLAVVRRMEMDADLAVLRCVWVVTVKSFPSSTVCKRQLMTALTFFERPLGMEWTLGMQV